MGLQCMGTTRTQVDITQVNIYLQEMLKMQFQVSDIINHKPTKGQLREKFIHRMVIEEFPWLRLESGILYCGDWQSTQADFLWLTNTARIGNCKMYNLNECKMFMEIKSCAKAPEFRAINKTAEQLKKRHSTKFPIRVGMFCYSTNATEQTVLKKFGFSYDRELEGYRTYQSHLDQMKNVDFMFSLNMGDDDSLSPYFVIRDYMGECTLYKNNPVIQLFFNLFRGD